ncbi:MAG: 2-hydroxyacid dehydrogenase [Bosea sp. (in: a-proteobacteria)]|uniref:2-hydroxyacid dehydrogenase n=1 Tax=Bosea sp. (in: a-proteobacteria) TaxID=1871050 RepID=UPI0027342A70|nr:2-hydroxyacid dehydrogenase [Bosea sp. (in: a-proteobacteria)]MDP3255937.1 2-hydroxyacid dehydrogenase [Bosea sp. (in: a-proteobacteria)]MDP3321262.1 2-hydroxyacid dehydrogenase [Bosea sp. (in: a-proteobacteria)]
MTETICLLDMTTPARAEKLRALLPPGFVLTHGTARGDEHMKEIIAQADYAISGQVAVSGDVLRAGRKLKLLHKWGVGYDNIDIATAKELGIKVARTTGSNAVPVAEFALGLMISALRYIGYGHAELKKGHWSTGSLPGETFMLSGKTVGLIGFGAIGQNVARLLRGFGCTILYSKRHPLTPEEEAALGVRHASLDEILAQADVVSLHCPLTPETTNLIGREAFAKMKKTAVLINVARGGVVDESALVIALRDRVIAGAAMDVYAIEPLPADSELLTLDNLVVTPHLAAMAADNFAPTVSRMFANIAHVSRGEPVPAKDLVV